MSEEISSNSNKHEILLEMLKLVGSTIEDANRLYAEFLLKMIQVSAAERGILFFIGNQDALVRQSALDKCGNILENETPSSESIPREVARCRKPICIRWTPDGKGDFLTTSSMDAYDIRSVMCVPLETDSGVLGVIYVDSRAAIREFTDEDLQLFTALCRHLALLIENARFHLKEREWEASRRESLENEIEHLRRRLSDQKTVMGVSQAMTRLMKEIQQVARTDASVFLMGETGTGKESIARSIHDLSLRRSKPFIVIDCSSIPEGLLESELFGHEKGAFTNAISRKIGKFELADSGTVFLDEIGDLQVNLQKKLLRVLQQKTIMRVGGTQDIPIDIRIVAATNRDVESMVKNGDFRSDLYYRLSVVNFPIPPLRNRGEDIILLAQHFLDRFSKEYGRNITGFTESAIRAIRSYRWPGNVRELMHHIQRAVILSDSKQLSVEDMDLTDRLASISSSAIPEQEIWSQIKSHILNSVTGSAIKDLLWEEWILKTECWMIGTTLDITRDNKTRAAWLLGLERRQLTRLETKIKKMNLGVASPNTEDLRRCLLELLYQRNQYSQKSRSFDNVFKILEEILIDHIFIATGKNRNNLKKILGISNSIIEKRLNAG